MKKYCVMSLFLLISPFANAAVEFDGTTEYTTEEMAFEIGDEAVVANFENETDTVEDYTNFYSFTVPTTQDVTFSFNTDGPDGGEGSLNFSVMGPNGVEETIGNGEDGSITFADLSPDTYLLEVDARVLNEGSYTLSSSVSPVPEPSTLALMMAGFGLVGFMSNRRRQFV
ncbi:FxDxF family PEP-CTERM protein [Methylophaga sp.]|jgi:hypothetical protein|uniref:FxDxF family PEP-CTERM protein n=1 Tax=Methylophaga sp. TaxID=2024840 RepID=UPI0014001502|nr:FxDxF family PEP-CTERM protein [Methylophaga sp.]MTI62589.1 PEP-CTERM sorting domain-containing protein [Methylophaga sp.]